MALKIGSLMFSVTESFESNFGISSFFTIFENKLFKVSAVSDSDNFTGLRYVFLGILRNF